MISSIAGEVQWHFHDLKLWDNTFFETSRSCVGSMKLSSNGNQMNLI